MVVRERRVLGRSLQLYVIWDGATIATGSWVEAGRAATGSDSITFVWEGHDLHR